jgi:hypothetical protein
MKPRDGEPARRSVDSNVARCRTNNRAHWRVRGAPEAVHGSRARNWQIRRLRPARLTACISCSERNSWLRAGQGRAFVGGFLEASSDVHSARPGDTDDRSCNALAGALCCDGNLCLGSLRHAFTSAVAIRVLARRVSLWLDGRAGAGRRIRAGGFWSSSGMGSALAAPRPC